MPGLTAIIKKEFKNLAGGGWGAFLLYAIISVLWSFPLFFYGIGGIGNPGGGSGGYLWFVFFSVIVTANFSGTVFISERVSGTLEILITSGLSRDAVLFGKMIFVIAMTTVIGVVCALLAALWCVAWFAVTGSDALSYFSAAFFFGDLDINVVIFNIFLYPSLYLSATFLNAAASAYLSVRMGNPRFLHFVNLSITGAAAGLCEAASVLFNAPAYIMIPAFLLPAALFTLLARREFAGERIIRPVIF